MRLPPACIWHLGVQTLHALSQFRCWSREEFRGPTSPPKHRNPCRGKRALLCLTLPCTLLLWSVLSVDTEPASRADVTMLSVDTEHHKQMSLCCQNQTCQNNRAKDGKGLRENQVWYQHLSAVQHSHPFNRKLTPSCDCWWLGRRAGSWWWWCGSWEGGLAMEDSVVVDCCYRPLHESRSLPADLVTS